MVERDSALGQSARRSCRPIAAERGDDGRLLLVLGCWWPPDHTALTLPATVGRLEALLSEFLDDQVRAIVATWPGGMAPPRPGPEPDEVEPPDLLANLPLEAREAARLCESALQRLFFARAWSRGIRLVCQYQALHYRVDFALPRERIAAEVVGWHGPRFGRAPRWERQQQLGAESWQVLYFSGHDVHRDVERCVEGLLAARPHAARGR
jgi:very-short-patch-repair endonuclease